ncbi:hypothetical protein ACMFMG_003552 [Clarireedia jacksonii]
MVLVKLPFVSVADSPKSPATNDLSGVSTETVTSIIDSKQKQPRRVITEEKRSYVQRWIKRLSGKFPDTVLTSCRTHTSAGSVPVLKEESLQPLEGTQKDEEDESGEEGLLLDLLGNGNGNLNLDECADRIGVPDPGFRFCCNDLFIWREVAMSDGMFMSGAKKDDGEGGEDNTKEGHRDNDEVENEGEEEFVNESGTKKVADPGKKKAAGVWTKEKTDAWKKQARDRVEKHSHKDKYTDVAILRDTRILDDIGMGKPLTDPRLYGFFKCVQRWKGIMDVKRKQEFDRRIHKGYVIRVQTLDGGLGTHGLEVGEAWTGYYYPVSVRMPSSTIGLLGKKERTFVLGRAHYGCKGYDPWVKDLEKKYTSSIKPRCRALHVEGRNWEQYKYREASAGARFMCSHGNYWDVTLHERHSMIITGLGGEHEPPVLRWRKWLKKEREKNSAPVSENKNTDKEPTVVGLGVDENELGIKESSEAVLDMDLRGSRNRSANSDHSPGPDPDAVTEYPSSSSETRPLSKPVSENLTNCMKKSPSRSGSSKGSGGVKAFRPHFRRKTSATTNETTAGDSSSDSGLERRLFGRAKKG